MILAVFFTLVGVWCYAAYRLIQMRAIADSLTRYGNHLVPFVLIGLEVAILFFTQVNATFRPRHIVVGQYLGFTALIVASLPGFFGGLIVPKAIIGLLGFVPMAIGIKHLVSREDGENEVQAVSGELNRESNSPVSKLANLFNPQIFNVAAVTIANGGDNIGIYLPLFASSDLQSLAVILTVFYLSIAFWCYAAYRLTRQRAIATYEPTDRWVILFSLAIALLVGAGVIYYIFTVPSISFGLMEAE